MSIFVNESAMPIGNPIEAETGYIGESGAYTILAENVMNDMAMFNTIIAGDFAESKAVHENASQDQLMVLTENAGLRLIENIKAFLSKAFKKIKGLILSFIDRMNTVVIRDNKKLVDKYRAEVVGKDLTSDNFKYTWTAVQGKVDDVYPSKMLDFGAKVVAIASDNTLDINNIIAGRSAVDDMLKEPVDAKGKMLAGVFGINPIDYTKALDEVKENLFDDKEEKEGLSRGLLSNIMNALSTSSDLIKSLKKAQSDVDKVYNKHMSDLNKMKAQFERNITKSKTGSDEETIGSVNLKSVNSYYEFVKVEQEVVTKAIGIVMSLSKFKIKESRAVFTRAVSFRGKTEALNNSGSLFVESSDASNDVVEGDKDTTVEINIEIEDPQNEPELVEALEDESDAIVEEQFHGGYEY